MYKLTRDPNTVLRIADDTWIQAEPENKSYQDYLAWLKEGNTPAPAEAPDVMAAAKARIVELEAIQIKETARFIREETLKDAEEKALAEFGIDPAALYAMGEGAGAPPPAMAYRRLKDIDNAIKAEREKFA